MNTIIKKLALSFVMISLTVSATAQNFRLTAQLDTIASSGYYNIQLPPEVNALSNSYDLDDIRIKNSKGLDVPYFIYSENPVRTVSSFIDYKLKSNNVRDSLNIVIIDNTRRERINHFSILIDNADVVTHTTVRGSNDLSQWYIVKRTDWITANYFDKSTQILDVDIPEGNYEYYEIVLGNSQASPLNVRQVGRINNANVYGQFTKIDTKGMLQSDDAAKKCSYLSFPHVPFEYRIGRLVFHISSKANYVRQATLSNGNNRRTEPFTLSSSQRNSLLLSNFELSKNSKIEINNADNLPLVIDSVSIYTLNRYLCAYLDAEQEYTLLAGNDSIRKPDYDIEHFKKDIPENLPTIKTSNLKILDKPVITPQADSRRELSLFEKPAFMWSVIIIVSLFLIFVCFKMISEMKKKK